MASTRHDREDVEAVVGPVVVAAGLDLEGLTARLTGQSRRIAVLVDKDGGVGIDECAELSREISRALDEAGVMGEDSYDLEVGSPGATRPLTRARHWRRASGRLVKVVTVSGETVVGRLVEVDVSDERVEVDVADERTEGPNAEPLQAPTGSASGDSPRPTGSVVLEVDGEPREVTLSEVRKARVELEFRSTASGAEA